MEAGIKFNSSDKRPNLRLVTSDSEPEVSISPDFSESPLPPRHEAPLHPAHVARYGLSSAMTDARRRLVRNRKA